MPKDTELVSSGARVWVIWIQGTHSPGFTDRAVHSPAVHRGREWI